MRRILPPITNAQKVAVKCCMNWIPNSELPVREFIGATHSCKAEQISAFTQRVPESL